MRYGFSYGDKVQPTKEYLEQCHKEGFKENDKFFMVGTIERFPFPKGDSCDDLVQLRFEGEKYLHTYTCHWLEKYDPCKTCDLGIESACTTVEVV
jgi:hypothetical protein